MVTNTPVGVLAAIVILPSRLDFPVVHRLLRQTSTRRDHGCNELCDRRLYLDDGDSHVTPGSQIDIQDQNGRGPDDWTKRL